VLGLTQDCDALLFAAKELPYLTDAAELSRTLARLDRAQAWSLVIAPLLDSEIRALANPPKLPAPTAPPTTTELTVESKSKSLQSGISTYEGNVRARLGTTEITCDKLALVGESAATPRILTGVGNVTIKRAATFDLIQADQFTYHLDAAAFTLSGNVRLTRGDRTLKFRAASLSAAGDLRDAVSLLDDFDNAPRISAQLAMLPRLTAVYADDELSPRARYVLALTLLRPHLVWQLDKRPSPTLESFMYPTQSEDPDLVAALLHRDDPDLTCKVKDPAHADVVRATRLLKTITDGEPAIRARIWQSLIQPP
jgi:lipopolysaccharide export system protein LptA